MIANILSIIFCVVMIAITLLLAFAFISGLAACMWSSRISQEEEQARGSQGIEED